MRGGRYSPGEFTALYGAVGSTWKNTSVLTAVGCRYGLEIRTIHRKRTLCSEPRVLLAYHEMGACETAAARRGSAWLAAVQRADGGWGGGLTPAGLPVVGSTSSVEETALAVEALLAQGGDPGLQTSLTKGLQWLVQAVMDNGHRETAPIGFYFAKLWYHEKLYPMIFAVAALGRAVRRFGTRTSHHQ